MSNLILTPTYKSFDIVRMMCDAIDKYSSMPYVHILIDDGSDEPMPIPASFNRRILVLKRDYPGGPPHKNGLGQALQLGYDWANQMYFNEGNTPVWNNVFVMESDVVVLKQGWDAEQVNLIPTLPEDWGTLDVQSVDEDGKVTYPCTVSPRHDEFTTDKLEWIHYCDFQSTLINPKVFEAGIKFSDAPSHFDILFGRKLEALGMKCYRSRELQVLHVNGGGNSRQFLI